jgi:UDP-N-acetyl-D-mannosaminuronic acid dehydrogenase
VIGDGVPPRLRPRAAICVLGLGYIGLPTATMFAITGYEVIGVDPSPRVQAALHNGRVHVEEPGLEALVLDALQKGLLRVQVAPEPADAFIIAVPTPFIESTKGADLRYVEQAAESLVPILRPGNLVVLESTVPPGTTRAVLAPILARSGLEPGRDLCVAHCPERVLPGRILRELVENDRLAGGMTSECAEQAAVLYESFVKGAVLRTDATTAEMAKVMENTYRDVNIALANEFALIAERVGVDVWEAIRLANRHPRVQMLRPGPGVGGHCIAVDPWFLVQAAPQEARLIQMARHVNDSMPHRVLDKLRCLVQAPKAVALLGVTYKADVDDIRESPALQVARLAVEHGYDVRLYDPHVAPGTAGLPAPLLPLEQAVRNAEVVVVLVDHTVFRQIDVAVVASLAARLQVLDTRGGPDRAAWQARGFRVAVLGNGRDAGMAEAYNQPDATTLLERSEWQTQPWREANNGAEMLISSLALEERNI